MLEDRRAPRSPGPITRRPRRRIVARATSIAALAALPTFAAITASFERSASAQRDPNAPSTAPSTSPSTSPIQGDSGGQGGNRVPDPPVETPEEPSLLQGGSTTPTPVVDGDIENVPNLTDIELATARLTISAQKAQANLSVAPLLIPGRYTPVASELRAGISAGSDGAFGLGLAVSVNQPRMRLAAYAEDPSFCEPDRLSQGDPIIAALDAEIEATLGDLCGLVATACGGSPEAACSGALKECAAARPAEAGSPGVPAVLRLLKVVHRVETLKEKDVGSPPPPPRAADGSKDATDPVALLAAYVRDVAAHEARRAALAALRAALPGVRELRIRRERAGEAAVLAEEQALLNERRLCRLEAAYLRSSLVTLGASLSFFPLFFGPDPAKGSGADAQNAHYLRRADVALAYRFYASRRVSAQLRGGFRAERGDSSEASPLLWRALAGADLGFFLPVTDVLDDTGFQRGLGFGLSGTAWFCGADGGCETDVGRWRDDAAAVTLLPLSRRIQLTGFVEWRQAAAFQIRAGVEARMDSVVGSVGTGSNAVNSPMLTRFIPTLGIGSSFWGL